MTRPELPPLPGADVEVIHDYYDGWIAYPTPEDRNQDMKLYRAETMQEYARAAVRAERERCAAQCKALATRYGNDRDEAFNAACMECADLVLAAVSGAGARAGQ